MGQVIDKTYNGLKVPQGEKITFKDGKPVVPNKPIIPFIEGDLRFGEEVPNAFFCR